MNMLKLIKKIKRYCSFNFFSFENYDTFIGWREYNFFYKDIVKIKIYQNYIIKAFKIRGVKQ